MYDAKFIWESTSFLPSHTHRNSDLVIGTGSTQARWARLLPTPKPKCEPRAVGVRQSGI